MKQLHHVQAVVFDCDGVMFDTTGANTAYYNHLLNRFGLPDMTPEQFAYTHMHTVEEALEFLFEDERLLQKAREYRLQMSYLPFLSAMEIEPDLKPLLRRLKPGYKTAVATNRTDTMNRVLKTHGLDADFDLVVTALDVSRPKPFPDQLIKVFEHFNLDAHQMLYIGDSELDAAAAHSARVPFAAYANRNLTADFHIERLKEIEEILKL